MTFEEWLEMADAIIVRQTGLDRDSSVSYTHLTLPTNREV